MSSFPQRRLPASTMRVRSAIAKVEVARSHAAWLKRSFLFRLSWLGAVLLLLWLH